MKLLHTADWHLGDNFHGYDRQQEHAHFLQWLEKRIEEEMPDALLVAGDIFDNANPSAQAEEMLFRFLADVTRNNEGLRVILTAGNHDSGRRLQAPAKLLSALGVEVRGVVEHDDRNAPIMDNLIIPINGRINAEEKIVVLAVPYLRTGDYEFKNSKSQSVREFFRQLSKRAMKIYGKDAVMVLMAHLYAAGSEIAQSEHSERLVVGGEDCIDVGDINRCASYVALGHIHKAQQVGKEDDMVFYCGSALPMSFAERNYQHGVNRILIDEQGRISVERIEYRPLRKLMSIPNNGAVSLAEVLRQIKSVPNSSETDPMVWPYMEIKLKDVAPSLSAQNEILNVISQKAVRLCRIVRVASDAEDNSHKQKMESVDQLRNVSPLDIALEAYLQATGKEMDEELISRFKIATAEAQENDN